MLLRIIGILTICLAVCGFTTCQNRQEPVLPPTIPKPVLDYTLLGRCDSTVPAVEPTEDMIPFLNNHLLTVRKLDACACKQISLRNATCKLVANTCEFIPECEVPNGTTK